MGWSRAAESIRTLSLAKYHFYEISAAAFQVAIEVLTGNGVAVLVDALGDFTPTPVVSHAILTFNKGRSEGLADGIVVTPSHNPPRDGGFKYNPPHGGPADTDVTAKVEKAANAFLAADMKGVTRMLASICAPVTTC